MAMDSASPSLTAPRGEHKGPDFHEVDETSMLKAQVHAMKQEMARRDAVLRRTRLSADHSRAQLVESIGAVDAARAYAEERLAAALAAHEADRVSAWTGAQASSCNCMGGSAPDPRPPVAIGSWNVRCNAQEEWSRQWIGLKLENTRLKERLQEFEVDKELQAGPR